METKAKPDSKTQLEQYKQAVRVCSEIDEAHFALAKFLDKILIQNLPEQKSSSAHSSPIQAAAISSSQSPPIMSSEARYFDFVSERILIDFIIIIIFITVDCTECRNLLPTVVESYVNTLKWSRGSGKYVMECLPRVLTLWLDFGWSRVAGQSDTTSTSTQMLSPASSGVSVSVKNTPKNTPKYPKISPYLK